MKATLSVTRTDQLQFLRFLAFCFIFIHHSSLSTYGYPTASASGLAVSFFFILSGFISALSLDKKDAPMHWYSPFVYLWGKYKRVLPMHLFTLAISVLCSYLPFSVAYLYPDWLWPHLISFVRNILLIQSWANNNHCFDYNGVSWFLSTLMFSYFITIPVAAVLKKVKKIKVGKLILFVLLAGCVAANFAYCYLTRNMNQEYFHYIFPPARCFEYVAGMILYHLLSSKKEPLADTPGLRFGFTILELLVLAASVCYLFLPAIWSWTSYTSRWILPNLLILTVFAFGRGYLSKLFRLRPLKLLGDISFECFLFHHLILRTYESFFYFFESSTLEDIVFTIYCLGLTVCIALFSHRRVETGKLKK